MLIKVTEIPAEGAKRLVGEEPPEVLDLQEPDAVVADGPLRYELTASLAGCELLVRGAVRAAVRFRCSRCGELFRQEVAEPSFLASVDIGRAPGPGKPGLEVVDLTGELRESILLTFPSYPLCSAACRGLCAQCGANLNRKACRCKPPAGFRWAMLDGLELKR